MVVNHDNTPFKEKTVVVRRDLFVAYTPPASEANTHCFTSHTKSRSTKPIHHIVVNVVFSETHGWFPSLLRLAFCQSRKFVSVPVREEDPVREEAAPPKVEAGMTIEEWTEVKRKIANADLS